MMRGRGPGRTPVSRHDVTATVKWFNPTKGFGFVQLDDGSPDAFLHISVVQDAGHAALPQGATIVCDIAEGQKGLQVASINRVESMPEAPLHAHRPERFEPSVGGAGPGGPVEGTVKFFLPEKGFGFVTPDNGGQDVFISARVLEPLGITTLEPRQRVRLQARMGQRGPMAETIELLEGP